MGGDGILVAGDKQQEGVMRSAALETPPQNHQTAETLGGCLIYSLTHVCPLLLRRCQDNFHTSEDVKGSPGRPPQEPRC